MVLKNNSLGKFYGNCAALFPAIVAKFLGRIATLAATECKSEAGSVLGGIAQMLIRQRATNQRLAHELSPAGPGPAPQYLSQSDEAGKLMNFSPPRSPLFGDVCSSFGPLGNVRLVTCDSLLCSDCCRRPSADQCLL